MLRRTVHILVTGAAVLLACCSSDPEGPVTKKFLEEGTYGVRAGDTYRFVEVASGTTVSIPRGVGSSRLLAIGDTSGISFEAILIKFDFTLLEEDSGKTISTAFLHLPVRSAPEGTVQGTDTVPFSLPVAFYELLEEFSEDDTITSVPPYDPMPIPDSLGTTERELSIENTDFNIDKSFVEEWIEGTRQHHGVIILVTEEPEELGLIEMNAREFGSDPPAIRVEFTDTTTAAFADTSDYSIAILEGEGLNCVGGIATRVYFDFTLDGLDERAMIHRSNLVLTVRGEDGFGATPGEWTILGLDPSFNYYLYTPQVGDPADLGFLEGTGVDRGSFVAYETKTLRIPLRGFVRDIVGGLRENTGLVFQSNLETGRIQRASFYGVAADSLFKPYIEVIYSLPGEFSGGS